MEGKLIFGVVLIFIILLREFIKYFEHQKLIGKTISISQSASPSDFFTDRFGLIIKKIKIGSANHFVVQLNEPIEINKITFTELIIKEKGNSHAIGSNGGSEVHLLTPLVSLNKKRFSLEDFEHIGWGTVLPDNMMN